MNWRLHTNGNASFPLHCLETNTITATLPPNMNHFVVRKKMVCPLISLHQWQTIFILG
ncbi:hypothetical protein [Pseudobacter ginsenosidimutans]|uniref:hypothetical protein n=1 Tax=Pseudobacter ginsenosidimutans TaxID=661488 RepID=UPI0013157224|nr:hypothetical protein [Pseudobacter ginsenosidimutans]